MTIAANVISRRRLAKLSALSAAGAVASRQSFGQTKTITAQEVVNQIKSHIGVPWNESSSRDTFKAGDPNTPVKGVASCFMSTFDVIKRANEAGLNFVITHEPTFWGDPESATMFKDDPILKIKLGYIERNKMIVWRIHDHWHAHRPDAFRESMNKALGWTQYYDEQKRLFKLPATTLKAVADRIASATKSRSVRVVGDPGTPVTVLAQGGHEFNQNRRGFSIADAVRTSEAREWDTVEYVRDLVASGEKKGYVLISHEAGEELAMGVFAQWLPEQIPGLRAEFIPTTDRMWIA